MAHSSLESSGLGPEQCAAAVSAAVRSALTQLLHDQPHDLESTSIPHFEALWFGIAGCARPPDFQALQPLLYSLFVGDTAPPPNFKLSNDGELLTAPFILSPHQRAITLICGTGSLALSWVRTPSGVTQVGRSGGWGFLLGDEGSGWSLGREGIKSVLTHSANGHPLLPWHLSILDLFDAQNGDQLLRSAISLEQDHTPAAADGRRKNRVTRCAGIVGEAAGQGDALALDVMDKVAREVTELLRPLVVAQEYDLHDTLLVVGGGLGQSQLFWSKVDAHMLREGWSWVDVIKVSRPAVEGVRSLAKTSEE